MERKAAQPKNISEELKQGLPTLAQAKVNKEGGERLTFPSHRRWPPAPSPVLTARANILFAIFTADSAFPLLW